MRAIVSKITGVSIACSTVGSDADQRKHQSSASLAFVRGTHRWAVNSPHKRPVTRQMFPFDDVIMSCDVSVGWMGSNCTQDVDECETHPCLNGSTCLNEEGSFRCQCLPGHAGKYTWWRHQMETFSALLAICAGNSPVPGEFPTQRPATRSFDAFFDLSLNKRLSKQS